MIRCAVPHQLSDHVNSFAMLILLVTCASCWNGQGNKIGFITFLPSSIANLRPPSLYMREL